MKRKLIIWLAFLSAISMLAALAAVAPTTLKYYQKVVLNYEIDEGIKVDYRNDSRGFDILYTYPVIASPGNYNPPHSTSSSNHSDGSGLSARTVTIENCPPGWYAFELAGGRGGNANVQSRSGGGVGGQGGVVQGAFYFSSGTITLQAGKGGAWEWRKSGGLDGVDFGAGRITATNIGGGGGCSRIWDGPAGTGVLVAVAGGGGGGGSATSFTGLNGTWTGGAGGSTTNGAGGGGGGGGARRSSGIIPAGDANGGQGGSTATGANAPNGNPYGYNVDNYIGTGGAGGNSARDASGGGSGGSNGTNYGEAGNWGGGGGGGYTQGEGGKRGSTSPGDNSGGGGGGGSSFFHKLVAPAPDPTAFGIAIPTITRQPQSPSNDQTVNYNGYAWVYYLGPRYPGELNEGTYHGPEDGYVVG